MYEKLKKGLAEINKECKNAYRGYDNQYSFDYIAFVLIDKVYDGYQRLGFLPEQVSFFKLEGW